MTQPPTFTGAPAHHGVPQQGYAVPPALTPPPGQRRLADFGERLLAWLIDTAVLTAIFMVLMIPLMLGSLWVMLNSFETGPDGTVAPENPFAFFGPFIAMMIGFLVLQLGILYIYKVQMMYRTGQTLGKRVMKLRIIMLDPTRPLTRQVATRRWLVESVGGAFLPFFVYLDGFWQLWDQPYRQCLHDKFAQTVVVKEVT